MSIEPHRRFFLVVAFLAIVTASAEEKNPLQNPVANRIFLDVVVTPKSGTPVSGLLEQDFTILDNSAPQTITSF
jgi:hypothetical protein